MFNDKNKKLILKLPFGFRDVFPVESSERIDIERIIREVFIMWGYGEIKTPVVEYTKNISSGIGRDWKNKLMSFFDVDGNLISLRADMTIPIARLAGMRIKPHQLPVRFFYFANSFRQSGIQKGQKRVLNQAGFELIGADSLASDIEVLSIIIEILYELDIKDFKIAIGNIKFIEGICRWLGLDEKEEELFRRNLKLKNFVAISDFLENKDSHKSSLILKLLKPAYKLDSFKENISKIEEASVKESLDYIMQVYMLLEKMGFEDNIMFDLSMIRDFDYYSGLIFEVYSPESMGLLGNGGRYDSLIKKFGLDVAATGFALDVDLLHQTYGPDRLKSSCKKERVILSGKSGNFIKMMKIAKKLRKNGIIAELLFDSCNENRPLAGNHKADYIYRADFDNNKISVIDLREENKFKSGQEKEITIGIDEFLK